MQKIQLSIPQPCHENWDNMTPTDQGRFCNACAKQVIDFSTMNDAQVLNYFSTIKNEKVCGRAYPDQLERAIAMPREFKKKKFWYWNYLTMLLLFFCKVNNSVAQKGKTLITTMPVNWEKDKISNLLKGKEGGLVITQEKIISGKILDSNENPIPFASIQIKGTKQGVSADARGAFKIKLMNESCTLLISAVGFKSSQIQTSFEKNTYEIVLTISDKTLEGEIVFVGGIASDYYPPANPKHIALLVVKDNASLQPIKNATVIINKNGSNKLDTVFTDSKGLYKLKKINEYDNYIVKINADGFAATEIKIKGYDFDDRKETKKIFLEKLPSENEYKKLDDVMVKAYKGRRTVGLMGSVSTVTCNNLSSTMGGILVGATVKRTFEDSLKLITTKITNSLKIYPNPVAKGNAINLSLKLNETGNYNIQIIDASGNIVLQKQINALVKDFTNQIQTESKWSSGIYFVRILGEENKLISTNRFVIL